MLFLSHGGGPCWLLNGASNPMMSEMDEKSKGAEFFRTLTSSIGQGSKPKAIVIISAHWEEAQFTVNSFSENTPLTYDYYGFPPTTYAPHLTYPAKSDAALQDRAYQLIKAEFGAEGAAMSTTSRGFDHGVFIPLKLAFPEADVPIVQVSCRSDLDFTSHIRLGKALAPLADEGFWIIGSGSTTHNLREIMGRGSWVAPFVSWLTSTLVGAHEAPKAARDKMTRLMELAPNAHTAHPRTEHLVPLLVCFGAAWPTDEPSSIRAKKIFSQTVAGTLSLDSFSFI